MKNLMGTLNMKNLKKKLVLNLHSLLYAPIHITRDAYLYHIPLPIRWKKLIKKHVNSDLRKRDQL